MSEEKKGFFSRLVEGLTKTRNSIASVSYTHLDVYKRQPWL